MRFVLPIATVIGWLLTPLLVVIRRFWELYDYLPGEGEDIQFIALISYAATSETLTYGSQETACLASVLADRYPKAKIFGGEFSKNPTGSDEWQKKRLIFPEGRDVNVGPVSSTTDELEAIIAKVRQEYGHVGSGVVVCEGAHSRRARLVWKTLLPDCKLYFVSVPADLAADLANPMDFQRRWQVWLMVNIVAFPFYKFFPGVSWFAKRNFSQPV